MYYLFLLYMGTQKKNEFEFWVESWVWTQNPGSKLTKNEPFNSKLTQNELLNSMVRLKTHLIAEFWVE